MMGDERAVNCLFEKLQSPGGGFFFSVWENCGREGKEGGRREVSSWRACGMTKS